MTVLDPQNRVATPRPPLSYSVPLPSCSIPPLSSIRPNVQAILSLQLLSPPVAIELPVHICHVALHEFTPVVSPLWYVRHLPQFPPTVIQLFRIVTAPNHTGRLLHVQHSPQVPARSRADRPIYFASGMCPACGEDAFKQVVGGCYDRPMHAAPTRGR